MPNGLSSIQKRDFDRGAHDLIVVDNGSTDDIARAHGADVLVKQNFQSPYAALNRGIRAVKGKSIAFAESDCIVDPEWPMQVDAAIDDGIGCLAGEIRDWAATTLIVVGYAFQALCAGHERSLPESGLRAIGLFDLSMQLGGDAAIA